MAGQQMELPGLARVPVKVSWEWRSKVVTTRPPIYVPHHEYELLGELEAETLFLVALFLRSADTTRHFKPWRNTASEKQPLHLSVLPVDWEKSDEVAIHLSQGLGESVDGRICSAEVKLHPTDFIEVHLPRKGVVFTGSAIEVATLKPPFSLRFGVVLVARGDTENCRGRWRLKPTLAVGLPRNLSFLGHGRCAGEEPNEE